MEMYIPLIYAYDHVLWKPMLYTMLGLVYKLRQKTDVVYDVGQVWRLSRRLVAVYL
jgi:transposase